MNKADNNMIDKNKFNWESEEVNKIWSEDKLSRKQYAKILTEVLTNIETPYTLTLKSPWGTGKSFFVEKWQETLKLIKDDDRKSYFCIYFSAWEAEIYDNPILYFVKTFINRMKEEPGLCSKVDELTEKALKFIVYSFVNIGLSYKFNNNLFNTITKLFSKKPKDVIEENETDKSVSSIQDSQKMLEEYIKEIGKEFKLPVFIFIDELDRCKPNFTINLLEKLKHLFFVKGMVFVLAVDYEQLEGSIKHLYGSHIDCEGYLMKFVNTFYNLPPVNNRQFAEFLYETKISKKLKSNLVDSFNKQKLNFISVFAYFSEIFALSLRDQQRIIGRLNLIISANKVLVLPTLYMLFIQLKYSCLWYKAVKNLSLINPMITEYCKDEDYHLPIIKEPYRNKLVAIITFSKSEKTFFEISKSKDYPKDLSYLLNEIKLLNNKNLKTPKDYVQHLISLINLYSGDLLVKS